MKTEDQVEKFFDTSNQKVWPGDYETSFFSKYSDSVPKIDALYKSLKVKTRVVVFLYDKSEYKQEFKSLKQAAKYLSSRENLRIGFVDDMRLIKKLKAKHSVKWFAPIAMSSIVL